MWACCPLGVGGGVRVCSATAPSKAFACRVVRLQVNRKGCRTCAAINFRRGLKRSDVDPPLCSGHAGLPTAFIASSVPFVSDWPLNCPYGPLCCSLTSPSLGPTRGGLWA